MYFNLQSMCANYCIASHLLINDNVDLLTGLSATLLEKETELSKIQKELKLLEPYKVGRFNNNNYCAWLLLVHS